MTATKRYVGFRLMQVGSTYFFANRELRFKEFDNMFGCYHFHDDEKNEEVTVERADFQRLINRNEVKLVVADKPMTNPIYIKELPEHTQEQIRDIARRLAEEEGYRQGTDAFNEVMDEAMNSKIADISHIIRIDENGNAWEVEE